MKRKYVVPKIFFESFVLTQHIASCSSGLSEFGFGNNGNGFGSHSIDSCIFDLGGTIIYATAAICGPNNMEENPKLIDEYCYNAPTEATPLFSS